MPLADVEKARPEPVNGFPQLAAKITSDPDKTTTSYRRYDRLSARNLHFLVLGLRLCKINMTPRIRRARIL
ncbi:hypothetical protein BDZ45DRAFT_680448 [Acephala macrosclerotiorum]|nr:hypothetical protein BDZ45DRAFT_680448 [Acephala macrosclerotiorum]